MPNRLIPLLAQTTAFGALGGHTSKRRSDLSRNSLFLGLFPFVQGMQMKHLSLLCCWVTASIMMFLIAGCGGSSSSSSSNLPQITAVTPNTAPTPDATTVAITGKNFSNSTTPVQVMFGKDAATSVTVVSDTQIVAVAPAKTEGGDVHITTSNGTSSQTINDVFASYPVPIVPVSGAGS